MARNINTLDMNMNSNDAYVPSPRSHLDSMESNAAYGGMAKNQDCNNLYDSIATSAENVTHAEQTIEIQNEGELVDSIYEYIEKDDRYV